MNKKNDKHESHMEAAKTAEGRHLANQCINYFLISICIMLAGCGNPSRKELSKILEQTGSPAILSAPDYCEPHFYSSSKFSWDGVWEGMSEGGSSAIADAKESYDYLGPILGALLFFIRVPVGVVVGGVSNAYQMPMKSHFEYILYNAFEGRNPGDQVAQHIYTNCKEKNPEWYFQRVYWGDSAFAKYRTASLHDKESKIKEFYGTLDSSGIQTLLVVSGTDYGLAAGTTKDMESSFFMTIHAELFRGKDGRRIYHREFNYKSTSHVLKEWEAAQGQLLKNEFDRACQNIGDMISNEFFSPEDHLWD